MPRYALPLLPALIATGAAGWFAQPRTTASVRAYSAPLRRASIERRAVRRERIADRAPQGRLVAGLPARNAEPGRHAPRSRPPRSPARAVVTLGLVLDADQAQAASSTTTTSTRAPSRTAVSSSKAP